MFLPIILVLAVVATRFLPFMAGDSEALKIVANFTPMLALVLCGAAYFKRRWAMVLPLVALILSDLALNAIYHARMESEQSLLSAVFGGHMLVTLPVYLALAFAGWRLQHSDRRAPLLFGSTILGVLAFHLATNTWAFATIPAYEKSLAGWWQSQTVGLPLFPAAWIFTAKMLIGNLAFTGIFCAIFEKLREPIPAQQRSDSEKPVASLTS